MKKRIVAVLLSSVWLAMNLAGCGNKEENTQAPMVAEEDTSEGEQETGEATRVFQLGHLDPSQDDNAYQIFCVQFKENLEAVSDGRLSVDIFGDGMLGGEIELMEGMKLGNVDMALITNNYYGNFVKDNMIFDLPFVFADYEEEHKILDSDEVMEPLRQQLYDEWGVKQLAWGDSGFRYVVNTKRPLVDVSDFNGLKIRLPENTVYVETFKSLGANPTTMAFSEAYTAVQQGTVDGLEITASAINTAGYYEICDYLSLTKHFASPIAINISAKVWESLSEEEQGFVQEAANLARETQREIVIENEQKLLDKMAEAGCQINEIGDIEEYRTAVEPVFDYIRTVIDHPELLDLVLEKLQ
ncbi:MAG: TRAP transporter substrate-binding protein [Lachnospiraceae bacterium]|nr:TRAP transporter substrate-binding protein [Lachnospiraceae bacterium]